jgi:archaellum component FlaD/FlaE
VHKKAWLEDEPKQVCFRVSAREFLGFMVHEMGIKVGQKSMKAIDKAVQPTNKT